MLSTSRGLVFVLILWIGAILTGGYFLFLGNGGAHGIRGNGATHVLESSHRAGSLGASRQAVLVAATKRYVEANPDAPADVAAGKSLAPADILNAELARDGAKFRVRKVDGLEAEIYDIS